ncbi:MAG TPA: hypothetical protein VEG25_02295 [Burkholderiales bacterium]|nr:hypothetical protein [Burkholderiales bacterium]
MQQPAYDFDTSVAAEGFRQAQMANEYRLSQLHRDAWLKQFLCRARKVFGLPVQQKYPASEFARELEQLGYFGFAHYVRNYSICEPDPRPLSEI